MRLYFLTALFSALLVFTLTGTASAKKLNCASFGGEFTRCSVPGADKLHVQLIHKSSHAPCKRDFTWGADSDGVWVDKGCRAIFKISGSKPASVPAEKGCPGDLRGNECAYYKDGYNAGREDGTNGMSMFYGRHEGDYDTRFEPYFGRGYEDGWYRYR